MADAALEDDLGAGKFQQHQGRMSAIQMLTFQAAL